MEELDVYVIRIYRKEQHNLDGIVEAVGSGEQRPFHSSEELWRALLGLPSPWQRPQSFEPNKEDPA